MESEESQKAQEVARRLNIKLADLEGQVRLLTQQTLNVESLAGKRVPFSYVIELPVTQGSDALVEGSIQTSRAGPFFAERLICAFRIDNVQDGGVAAWVGKFLPLSSRWLYPYQFPAGATGTQAVMNPLDFEFGWESDSSDRQRQDKYIPGDIMDRQDNDGIMAVSDIFPEGSTITFKMNPFRAVGNSVPWNDGTTGVSSYVFTAVLWGYKIIQPTQV